MVSDNVPPRRRYGWGEPDPGGVDDVLAYLAELSATKDAVRAMFTEDGEGTLVLSFTALLLSDRAGTEAKVREISSRPGFGMWITPRTRDRLTAMRAAPVPL